jgi:hypothetical protein
VRLLGGPLGALALVQLALVTTDDLLDPGLGTLGERLVEPLEWRGFTAARLTFTPESSAALAPSPALRFRSGARYAFPYSSRRDPSRSLGRRRDVAAAGCYVFLMSTSAARRAARATWEVSVSRPGARPPGASEPDDDAADDLYWLRVPRDERARLTWDLSRELYSLASRNRGVFDEVTGTFVAVSQDDFERRLNRAALGLTRR